MAAAAAVGGDVLIQNVIPKHLESITAKLREMGARITEYEDAICVIRTGKLRRANVKTLPYPGFPTDMQSQVAVCMSLAKGTSVITEGIYDTRFRYCAELNRMGAKIKVDTKVALIEGVEQLHGCEVKACDLRAGAAMVIAGLAADGTTTVEDVHYIERGYECMIEKLRSLGADITRIETPDNPRMQSVG
jgi:UDP-N-acetylglucosamine 1-carboxyvinyltransferase